MYLNWHPILCEILLLNKPLPKCLMHTAHKVRNNRGVLKSSSDWLDSSGFPVDMCLETKPFWCSAPLMEEGRHHVYNCDIKCLSDFQMMWNSQYRHIHLHDFLKWMVLYFHAPKHDAEQSSEWLLYMSVRWHSLIIKSYNAVSLKVCLCETTQPWKRRRVYSGRWDEIMPNFTTKTKNIKH